MSYDPAFSVRALVTLALGSLLSTAVPAPAAPGASSNLPAIDFDPTRVGWSEIEVKATKFLLSTTSVLELGTTSLDESDLLTATNHCAVMPSGTEVATIRIESRYLGRETVTNLWFDPVSARGIQGRRYDPGKREKIYRFTHDGLLTERRYPDSSSEEKLDPERWTKVSTTFYPFIPEPAQRTVVTDPGVIFWLLGAAPLHAVGDSIRVAVFSDERLLPVQITVEGEESVDTRYAQVREGREVSVSGRFEALRIALRPAPSADEDTRRRFQLLGLEGDIDVLVGKRNRLPLRIEGRVQVVGHVKVRLKRAVLERPEPLPESPERDSVVNSDTRSSSNARGSAVSGRGPKGGTK